MFKRPMSRRQTLTTNAIIGGAIGTFLATILGVPISALLILAAIAAAYAFRYRIVIVRKRHADDPIDV